MFWSFAPIISRVISVASLLVCWVQIDNFATYCVYRFSFVVSCSVVTELLYLEFSFVVAFGHRGVTSDFILAVELSWCRGCQYFADRGVTSLSSNFVNFVASWVSVFRGSWRDPEFCRHKIFRSWSDPYLFYQLSFCHR